VGSSVGAVLLVDGKAEAGLIGEIWNKVPKRAFQFSCVAAFIPGDVGGSEAAGGGGWRITTSHDRRVKDPRNSTVKDTEL